MVLTLGAPWEFARSRRPIFYYVKGDTESLKVKDNVFRIIGPFWGDRWIPLMKAGDAELCCFLWSAPEQTVEQTVETQLIWDSIAVTMTYPINYVSKRHQTNIS